MPAFAVRPGYRVTLVRCGLGAARFLPFDAQGRRFVSEPNRRWIDLSGDSDQRGYFQKNPVFLAGFGSIQAMVYRHD